MKTSVGDVVKTKIITAISLKTEARVFRHHRIQRHAGHVNGRVIGGELLLLLEADGDLGPGLGGLLEVEPHVQRRHGLPASLEQSEQHVRHNLNPALAPGAR